MSDVEKSVGVKLEAQDNTGGAFRSLGDNINKLKTGTSTLGATLKSLGLIAAGLFTVNTVKNFFSEGTQEALKDITATRNLTAQIENLGVAYSSVQPKVQDFIKSMFRLGQADTVTTSGLTELIRRTKDVDVSLKLSKLASDLAASGIMTYTENVGLLSRVVLEKGSRALIAYGINMKDTASVSEQLAAIQGLVTRSIESTADTTVGRITQMQTAWGEFQEQMGNLGIWFTDVFARTVNSTLFNLAESGGGFAKVIARSWTETAFIIKNVWNSLKSGDFKGAWTELTMGGKAAKQFDDYWNSLLGSSPKMQKNKADADAFNKLMSETFKDTGNASEKAAEKIKQSFQDLSKIIVQSFQDQQESISKLRSEIKSLDEQLNQDIVKANTSYEENIKAMAKKSKDRIIAIDKEIADERNTLNQGFRTRISDLEKEKAQEQSVIDRAGGIVTNIQGEVAKDEFTILQEKHAKELEEIKTQANKKREELSKEETARIAFLEQNKIAMQAPGFFTGGIKQLDTFLGSLGVSPTQQQFVFNFNGDVSDIETLKKTIISMLNREATLRGVSGK